MINGIRVKALRGDMTQRELAAKADITEVTLSNIENGHNKTPRMETVSKLAKALEVAPDDLMKW